MGSISAERCRGSRAQADATPSKTNDYAYLCTPKPTPPHPLPTQPPAKITFRIPVTFHCAQTALPTPHPIHQRRNDPTNATSRENNLLHPSYQPPKPTLIRIIISTIVIPILPPRVPMLHHPLLTSKGGDTHVEFLRPPTFSPTTFLFIFLLTLHC